MERAKEACAGLPAHVNLSPDKDCLALLCVFLRGGVFGACTPACLPAWPRRRAAVLPRWTDTPCVENKARAAQRHTRPPHPSRAAACQTASARLQPARIVPINTFLIVQTRVQRRGCLAGERSEKRETQGACRQCRQPAQRGLAQPRRPP